jgi:hypothetical protein
MELALNLAWALLAAVTIGLWTLDARREGASRRVQFFALALILLILLPVISVTDDLLAAQNPAETDAYKVSLRRGHGAAGPHCIFPPAALPAPVFAGVAVAWPGFAARISTPARAVDSPARASIQSRPPPAA